MGDASFDLTDLPSARWLADDGEGPYGVAFELADGVTFTVIWGAE